MLCCSPWFLADWLKIDYGSGDITDNVVYAFLATFMMFYLSEKVGMNVGVVGTLMALSKLFNGITGVLFGSVTDKTKMACPWMIFGFGCVITLVALFAVPISWAMWLTFPLSTSRRWSTQKTTRVWKPSPSDTGNGISALELVTAFEKANDIKLPM